MTSDQNPHRPVYVERVNAAVDFIERNLAEELTLEQVSEVAHFSPFHFHRVFTLLVGETLGRFVNRVRLERAATWLIQQPDRPVTDIATACGIHSPSSFSRSFREMFGVSPTQWREMDSPHMEEYHQAVEDILREAGSTPEGFGIIGTRLGSSGSHLAWEIGCGDLAPTTVEVVEIPTLEVAYVRHIGPYQGAAEVFVDIFNRLMTWAGPRGFVTDRSWIMAVYHDNPSITDDDRLRVSACVDVPSETVADGDVGRMRLDGGLCAVARFELGTQDYGTAWFALAGGWLPDSGYEPDDRLPFERYPVESATTSEGTEVVDICLPVRPLRRF